MRFAEREPQRIDQTAFGAKGNCQSACVAMLLGLRIEDVPNFNDYADYNGAMYGFLEKRGFTILTFPISATELRAFQKGFAIVGGLSPRGYLHAVLYRDGELWHDPHPERGGVEASSMDIVYPMRPFAAPLACQIEAKVAELADAIELACMFQSEQFHSRTAPSVEDRKRITAACETSARIRAEIIAAYRSAHPAAGDG